MSLVLIQITKSDGAATQEDAEEFERKLQDKQIEDANREDGGETYVVTHLRVSVDRWALNPRNANNEFSSEYWEAQGTSSTSTEDMEYAISSSPSTSEEMEEYDIIGGGVELE